jgi:hypothetical protein
MNLLDEGWGTGLERTTSCPFHMLLLTTTLHSEILRTNTTSSTVYLPMIKPLVDSLQLPQTAVCGPFPDASTDLLRTRASEQDASDLCEVLEETNVYSIIYKQSQRLHHLLAGTNSLAAVMTMTLSSRHRLISPVKTIHFCRSER